MRADLDRDRDAILSVWTRNLPAAGSLADQQRKFEWYYLDNPAGPGRCWLLLSSPGNRIIGAAGIGLRRIRNANTIVTVGTASDLAVDQEHRLLRPALMLQRAATQSVTDGLSMIYALPGKQSVGVVQRVGYRSLGHIQRYTKLLRIDRYLQPLGSVHHTLPRALAAITNPFLRLASAETWRRHRNYEVAEVSTFDDRFDQLWNSVSPIYPTIAVRNAEFLRWRYTNCPFLKYQTLGLFTPHKDRLLGYAVCHIGQNRQAAIIDLLADTADDALTELLAATVFFARGKGAVSLSLPIFHAAPFQASLKAIGFYRRQPGCPLMVFPGSAADSTQLRDWYFTLGDEDYN